MSSLVKSPWPDSTGGGGGFDPTTFPGVLLGIEANRLVGYSAGQTVSTWPDATGHSRTLTKQSLLLPTYQTGGPNSQPYVRLNVGGDLGYMQSPAFAHSQPYTVYIVVRCRVVNQAGNPTLFDGTTGNTGRAFQTGGTADEYGMYAGGTPWPTPHTTPLNWHLLTFVFNGSSSSIRVDNGSPVTGTAGTSGANGFTLGALPSDSDWGQIDVAFCWLVDGLVGGTDDTNMLTYVSTTFGVF